MAVVVENAPNLTSEEQRNIEIVRAIYRAYLEGDLDAVVGAMSPAVRIIGVSQQRTPPSYTGSYDGKAQAAAAFAEFQALVQYQEPMAPVVITARGDRVLVAGSDIRTSRSDGERTENRWTMIWTLRDGLVTELRVVEDTVPAE